MRELAGLRLQRFLRAQEIRFGTLAREKDRLRVLKRDGLDQVVFAFLLQRQLPPIMRSASAVPSTRARTLAKAVSRLVDVSSLNGEKPQSSVVPSWSAGMNSAA